MKKRIWEKLHTMHKRWINNNHSDDYMTFDEWLDEHEGMYINGYKLERNPFNDQIILTKTEYHYE